VESARILPAYTSEEAGAYRFGETVALTSIESTPYLLVSAAGVTFVGNDIKQASAHQFARIDGGWAEGVKLLGLGEARTSPFMAVAADGSEMILAYDSGPPQSGQGRVLTMPATTAPEIIIDDIIGTPVSASVRPGVVAVGLPTQGVGTVLIYRYESQISGWLADSVLGNADDFGRSVVLDKTGTRLVVGAPKAGINGQVETYIFVQNSWVHYSTVQPPSSFATQTDARFGTSVDIVDNWLAVGGPKADHHFGVGGPPPEDAGYVLLYEYGTFDYVFSQSIRGATEGDAFGTSVALATKKNGGYRLAVGAPGDDVSASNGDTEEGAAYSYSLNPGATSWSRDYRLVSSRSAEYEYSNLGVAVDTDGDLVVAGAPYTPVDLGGGFRNEVGVVLAWDLGALFSDGFETGSLNAWSSSSP
jgi:hypothetical protein